METNNNDIRLLAEGGVDYIEGLARLQNDQVLYQRIIQLFLLDENILHLQRALQEKEYVKVYQALHTLKGILGNISATRCERVVANALAFTRNPEQIDEAAVDRLCLDVVTTYEQAQAVLRTWLTSQTR